MSILSPRGGYQPTFPLTPDQLDQMRRLWEGAPELSARLIAEEFVVTKNTVIGHAHRKGWKPRKDCPKEPSTLYQRLDAHKARLDQVLAETRPYVEDRKKLVIADAELVGLAAE